MDSNPISIQMQKQCCTMWCWAAVLSTAVQSCRLACTAQSQVDFVNQYLGGDDCSSCCPNGPPDRETELECDVAADLAQVLPQFRLSYSGESQVNDSTFEAITEQIDKNRPVIAKISYDGSDDTHVLLIYGYSRPDTIAFGDPANGECMSVQFSAFRSSDAYTDPRDKTLHGSWNSTYVFDAV